MSRPVPRATLIATLIACSAAGAAAQSSSSPMDSAARQAPTPTTLAAHVDASRLRVASDSFTITARGRPIGAQRLTWTHDGNGWTLRDATVMPPMVRQESIISIDRRLAETALRQEGEMRGTKMRISLDFAAAAKGGSVKGTSLTPTNPAEITIDTVVAPGTIDDNAVTPLVGAVKWHDGMDIAFPVLTSGKGTIETYRMRVVGHDTLTVPAGTFDAWQVALTVGTVQVTMFVTRQAPYRIVRMRQEGTPLDIVLAR